METIEFKEYHIVYCKGKFYILPMDGYEIVDEGDSENMRVCYDSCVAIMDSYADARLYLEDYIQMINK